MTTTTTPLQVSAQAVEQLIRKDIETSKRLATLLTKEQTALKERSHNILRELLSEKQTLMAKLESNANPRSRWAGFLAERSQLSQEQCWARLLKELNSDLLPNLWQEFEDAIKQCKVQNEVNGKVISRSQSTLKQLLGVLRGQYIESPKLYNSAGTAQSQNLSHTVVKA